MKNKFAIILKKGIETWVALNTTAHLCAKLGQVVGDEIAGKSPIIDKEGFEHSGIPKYANAVLEAFDSDVIRSIIEKSKKSDLIVIDYPKAGLDTYTDEEFAQAVEDDKHSQMVYYGCCIYGKKEIVEKITSFLKLYK